MMLWRMSTSCLPCVNCNPNVVAKAGEVLDGGSYETRMSNIAVWNSVMDEHQYLVSKWNEFLAS